MIDWLRIVNRTRFISIVEPVSSPPSKCSLTPTITAYGRKIYIVHMAGRATVNLIDGDHSAQLSIDGLYTCTLLRGVGEFDTDDVPGLREITGEYCHQNNFELKIFQPSSIHIDGPTLRILIEVVCCTTSGVRFYDIDLCWRQGKLAIKHVHDRTSTPDIRYALTGAGYYAITLTENRFRVELNGREVADDTFPESAGNPRYTLDIVAMYTPRGIILRSGCVLINVQPDGYTIFNTSPKYRLCGELYATGNYIELVKSNKVMLYNLETKKKKTWKLPIRMVPIGYDEEYNMVILSTNNSIVGLINGDVVPLHSFSENRPRFISYNAELRNHTITIRNVITRLPMCRITIVPDDGQF